jgi:PhoPQ-activated pathogenicity-related protein
MTRHVRRSIFTVLNLLAVLPVRGGDDASAAAEHVPDALHRYVDRQEPAFDWHLAQTHETKSGVVHELHLVSQTWHDIIWEHALLVYEPERLDHPNHMLLMVTGGRNGGRPREQDMETGLALARLCGARVATLHQVPNQPLLGDHVEDDLITETWLKYLETGDDTWPLLFPMVKSAVKAMDALQAFSRQQFDRPIEGFVITGGSKRGWTSWLTPVADERVIATAPIVIDTLNFPVQMKYQLDTWGKYSEQIDDYTRKGLVRAEGERRTPREEALWKMMDPYTYRKQLTLPKLIINGTNDRYWVVDATKNYWPDLEGDKHILQVPNAGHSLEGGRELAFTTLAAFFRSAASDTRLPAVQWEQSNSGDELKLVMTSDAPAVRAQLWSAESPSRDFREARWGPRPLELREDRYTGALAVPAAGHVAFYGELQFELKGLVYSLTTHVFSH